MRFIIFGVGAIGGTVAACLVRSGQKVVGIARGRQLAAIRENGLTLRTPDWESTVRFDCVEAPQKLGLRDDDVVLLCVKSQDTEAALAGLRDAGAVRQPVFCLQNGVASERMALRHFDHVYGVVVLMPSDFATPGTVAAFGTPKRGIVQLGRYPSGSDRTVEAVVEALNAAGIVAFVDDDVMAAKYGKLLMNLGNVLDAAFPRREAFRPWAERAHEEALDVYRAAGIAWTDVGFDDPRRAQYLRIGTIAGTVRVGSSTKQSLVRHTGSIETDYLNGEIVLLGGSTEYRSRSMRHCAGSARSWSPACWLPAW